MVSVYLSIRLFVDYYSRTTGYDAGYERESALQALKIKMAIFLYDHIARESKLPALTHQLVLGECMTFLASGSDPTVMHC